MPDMSTTFGPVVPILRMYDLTRTLDFYVGYLGCTVDWQVLDGDGRRICRSRAAIWSFTSPTTTTTGRRGRPCSSRRKVWPNFTRSFTPPITDTCFLVWSDIRAAWK